MRGQQVEKTKHGGESFDHLDTRWGSEGSISPFTRYSKQSQDPEEQTVEVLGGSLGGDDLRLEKGGTFVLSSLFPATPLQQLHYRMGRLLSFPRGAYPDQFLSL